MIKIREIRKDAFQPDPSVLEEGKVDNEREFGTTPVNPYDNLYKDKWKGDDFNRPHSGVDVPQKRRLRRNKRRRNQNECENR